MIQLWLQESQDHQWCQSSKSSHANPKSMVLSVLNTILDSGTVTAVNSSNPSRICTPMFPCGDHHLTKLGLPFVRSLYHRVSMTWICDFFEDHVTISNYPRRFPSSVGFTNLKVNWNTQGKQKHKHLGTILHISDKDSETITWSIRESGLIGDLVPGRSAPSSPEIGRLQAFGPIQLQATPRIPAGERTACEGGKIRDLLIVGKGVSTGWVRIFIVMEDLFIIYWTH